MLVHRGRTKVLAALTCGLLVGATFVVTSLASHPICVQGNELGSVGPLSTVIWVIASPPGGSVNFSASSERSTLEGGSLVTMGSTLSGSTNASIAMISILDWNLYSVVRSGQASLVPAVACPSTALTFTYPGYAPSACDGCVVAPSVPAVVGARVVLPSNVSFDHLSSSTFNGSYAPEPIGNFSWLYSGGVFRGWQVSPSLASFGIEVGQENGPNDSRAFFTLSYSTPPSEMGIGIPILLQSGGTVFERTTPAAMSPGWSLWYNETYNFPASTDQGTWNVYLAAPASPFPIGGLLFEMTAAGQE